MECTLLPPLYLCNTNLIQRIYQHLMMKMHGDLQRMLSVYLKMEDQDAAQDGDEPLMEEHTLKQMNRAYARLLLASGLAHRCPSNEEV